MNFFATALAHFPGFASRSLRKLREHFGDYERAWHSNHSGLLEAGLRERTVNEFISWRNQIDPNELCAKLEKYEIRTLLRSEAEYPALLRESSDPPEVLFIRGILNESPSVAIVGSRKHTGYGRRCVQEIVSTLASMGLRIISGLALGIDGLAHETTLKAKGSTVAVLGSGLDDHTIYPRDNYRLAKRILESQGALVSEFPPGTPGLKHHFPMRNRIIAGLSLATVVIEAHENSGSLITAKLALEENREVLAVPGSIFQTSSNGCHRLISLGARPCLSAQSVLDALSLDRPELAAEVRKELPLNPLESRILSLIDTPKHADELARLDQSPASQVSTALSLLELKGCVRPIGGGLWARVGSTGLPVNEPT